MCEKPNPPVDRDAGFQAWSVRGFPGLCSLTLSYTLSSGYEDFLVKAYRCGVACARGDIIRSISSGSDGSFPLIFTRPFSVTR